MVITIKQLLDACDESKKLGTTNTQLAPFMALLWYAPTNLSRLEKEHGKKLIPLARKLKKEKTR